MQKKAFGPQMQIWILLEEEVTIFFAYCTTFVDFLCGTV